MRCSWVAGSYWYSVLKRVQLGGNFWSLGVVVVVGFGGGVGVGFLEQNPFCSSLQKLHRGSCNNSTGPFEMYLAPPFLLGATPSFFDGTPPLVATAVVKNMTAATSNGAFIVSGIQLQGEK